MKKEVGILTMERMDNRRFNSVGSSRIRMRWLLHYWPEAEEYVIGKKYDVLIFQKVYWGNMMKNFKGIKILDLCDPDWLEGKPVFEFIDMCDAVATSTQPLADYIKKMRPKAYVEFVPDRIYLPVHKPIKTVHEGPLKKVCWFGYHGNSHYLLNTLDELVKRGIELTAITTATYEPPLAYREKLKYKNVVWDYETLLKEVVKADAVLLPDPHGDEKAKFKSTGKVTQSWAQGMPVVKLPEDLDRFMDPKEREKESKKRLKKIKEDWDVRLSVIQMREMIEKIKKIKAKK